MVYPIIHKWDFRKEFCNTWNYNLHRYGNASGPGGVSTTTTIDVTVFSSFKDEQAVQFFNRWFSKKWYWSQSEQDHLGVGP
jgi:hypothetical protein